MNERKKPTVMLAEDDEDDYLLTKKALEESGVPHSLFRVKDGEELMDYLLRRGAYQDRKDASLPAIILLDLNMPKKGGQEALKEIKENPQLHKIPVVVLTTSRSREDIKRCYELGANSFITKPGNFIQFVELIKSTTRYWFEDNQLPENVTDGFEKGTDRG